MSASVRARFPSRVVVAAASRPRINSVDVATRTRKDLTSFPGEDAPRTGRRVPPSLVASIDEEDTRSHRYISAEDYEKLFQLFQTSPVEFEVEPQPLEPNAGPGTGNRMRPANFEASRTHTASLEATEEKMLKKQLKLRRMHF